MKRYLIPILLAIFVLASGLWVGCDTDNQQRIAELEQQVAALAEQVQELSSKDALPPKVIEKELEPGTLFSPIDWLPFHLKVGDRVEGEVSVSHGESVVAGQVRDPYGNVVIQTRHIGLDGVIRKRGFPWRFAFIAYIDGEYELGVFRTATLGGQSQPSAHLKITIYSDG